MRGAIVLMVSISISGAAATMAAQEPRAPGVVAAMLKGAGSGGGAGPKTYDASTLRPEQLKGCLTLGHEIDQATAATDARLVTIRTEEEALGKLQADIDRESKQGLNNQMDITRHNQRIATYNQRVGAHRQLVQGFNAELVPQKERLARFNDACAGHGFFDSDLAAIRGELPFDIGRAE